MSELALYRKYRPRGISEVVGQEHVVKTLANALAAGRISHAYLFTGPRGTGKTSVARLLARAVNCGGQNKPCNECELCQIPIPSNMDIIEIDAASNRRIDEMRDLRDKISLAPTRSKYKVYIIDEVHMLTTEAFNALLKTLEEPPAHAIFILATTEAHKLPETIISRTQRFNFRPIGRRDLVACLSRIATAEKISIEPEALAIIADISQGGLRDATSMLDQIANTGNSVIDARQVRLILGWSDLETINKLCLAIADHQPQAGLTSLDEMTKQGAQVGQVAAQLVRRWREFMLIAAGTVSANSDGVAAEVCRKLSIAEIVNSLETFAQVTTASMPQIALESAIVRLSYRQVADPILKLTEVKLKPESTPTMAKVEPSPAPDKGLWEKALLIIKSQNNSLYALLRSCAVEINTKEVRLTCRFSFHRDRLLEAKNQQLIERILSQTYGHTLKLICQLETNKPTDVTADPTTELVGSALEILGGEVIDG